MKNKHIPFNFVREHLKLKGDGVRGVAGLLREWGLYHDYYKVFRILSGLSPEYRASEGFNTACRVLEYLGFDPVRYLRTLYYWRIMVGDWGECPLFKESVI